GYQEYHVNPHAHKKLDNGIFVYMIENDLIDPKKVTLEFAQKDPIKQVALLEIKLNDDGTKIVGLDLDGDIVELK
ncbi:monocarboxylate transporter 12, partial [Biomphalaria glabrata]